MEIKTAQEKIKTILGEMQHPRLASFIALTEEIGEVADEVMKLEIYEEKSDLSDLKSEITDVLVGLLELANVYGIDLEREFEKKLSNLEPRAREWKLTLKDILKDKRKKLD